MEQEGTTPHATTGSRESVGPDTFTPGTPKPPFDPPRRRSSLGFSKTMNSPALHTDNGHHVPQTASTVPRTPQRTGSNIGRKRTIVTPFRYSQASPGHVAQVQKLFQSAKAELHVDMHYAASPIGSIGSRLPSGSQRIGVNQADDTSSLGGSDLNMSKNWRYSTVPAQLAMASFDVREPLPEELPGLSDLHQNPLIFSTPAKEPTSSGYVSPAVSDQNLDPQDLPPLPSSSPVSNAGSPGDISKLQQRMQELDVTRGSELYESSCESASNTDVQAHKVIEDITMPQSALAAADFALRRRGLDTNDENSNIVSEQMATPMSTQGILVCDQRSRANEEPDPSRSCLSGRTPCPDPLIHFNTYAAYPTEVWNMHRNLPLLSAQAMPSAHRPGTTRPRVNARGSPMPFSRPHVKSFGPFPSPGSAPAQYTAASSDPKFYHSYSRPPLQSEWIHQSLTGERRHRDRNWTRMDSTWSPAPSNNSYTLSNAVAAARGTSVVPEHNIRDSYRTDTLTPWLKPPNRFRKNGIGAEIQSQNQRRWPAHYNSGPGASNPSSITAQGSMSLYSDGRLLSDSPMRPTTTSRIHGRKRMRDRHVHTPDCDLANDEPIIDVRNPIRDLANNLQPAKEELISSIDGDGVLDQMQSSREGVRELSPNVSLWRKHVRGEPYSRKKRRPSYWDSDLREIRTSPAARGGIESSPIVSNRSMIAEVENTTDSGRDVEMIQGSNSGGIRNASTAVNTQLSDPKCLLDGASLTESL